MGEGMDGSGDGRPDLDKNISRTMAREPARCGFVVAGEGMRAAFCDRPAVGGGSYCAAHRALCQVRPGTAAAARIIAELGRAAEGTRWPRPGGLGDSEPLEATEPDEVAADVALPRAPEEA